MKSARGRMIIPANINHPELEPMANRVEFALQDQRQHRQLRASPPTWKKLKKLHTAFNHTEDRKRECLSTGRDITDKYRDNQHNTAHSPLPIGNGSDFTKPSPSESE